ncbi:hypothetical protein [Methylomonas sp. UP202]|uniref:hypothetical protein n=1 Tax=Methylomonas sp. UP202 TaxID=3040943 RepID=UPI002478DC6D|nr:hypothetical protein [Methylomonas sp. UP202]WGS84306.1 hypothetical protein QC632_14720 [Methylomonas sp. UP202]
MSQLRADWPADIPRGYKVRTDFGIGAAGQAAFAAIVGNRGAWISSHAFAGPESRAVFRFHRAGKSAHRTVNRVHRTLAWFHRAFQASESTVESADRAIAGVHRAVQAPHRTVYSRYRAENSAVSAYRVARGAALRASGAVFDNGGKLAGYRRGRMGKVALPDLVLLDSGRAG